MGNDHQRRKARFLYILEQWERYIPAFLNEPERIATMAREVFSDER